LKVVAVIDALFVDAWGSTRQLAKSAFRGQDRLIGKYKERVKKVAFTGLL
jgi:hypothetical protein